MLHPSYSELIQAINNNAEEDDNTMMLNSQVFSGTCNQQESKRQLIAGAEPLVPNAADKKPLLVAVDELYKVVKIEVAESDEETIAPATEEASETVSAPEEDNE